MLGFCIGGTISSIRKNEKENNHECNSISHWIRDWVLISKVITCKSCSFFLDFIGLFNATIYKYCLPDSLKQIIIARMIDSFSCRVGLDFPLANALFNTRTFRNALISNRSFETISHVFLWAAIFFSNYVRRLKSPVHVTLSSDLQQQISDFDSHTFSKFNDLITAMKQFAINIHKYMAV